MVIEIIDATAIDIITKVIEFLFTYPPNLEHTTPPNTIPNVGPNKHKDPKKINLTESSISKTNFIYLSPKYWTTPIPKNATLLQREENINILLLI